MKYCMKCGKELFDEAVICPGCGCPTNRTVVQPPQPELLQQLSERVKTNGVIWLVVAAIQILCGVFFNWYLLVVGVLNVVTAIQDLSYSKTVLTTPAGIVKRFEPLAGPIVTLIYNLIFGGLIGVAGSIYYLTAIRSFVMERREAFQRFEPAAI